jgi:hypothetical protein
MASTRANSAELGRVLAVLKTPEAKGNAVYTVAAEQYGRFKKRENARMHKEFEANPYSSFERKEWTFKIPSSLREGAAQAVPIAFQRDEFELGFGIASGAGVLEELVSRIEQVPVERKWEEKDPESAKTLPGYRERCYFTFSDNGFTNERFEPSEGCVKIDWAVAMKKELVEHVLKLRGRYAEAASVLVQLRNRGEAFSIFNRQMESFSPEEAAELCRKVEMGFEGFRQFLAEKGRHELAEKVEDAHLDSLANPADKFQKNDARRWADYFNLGIKYKGEGRREEFLKRATDALFDWFERDIDGWKVRAQQCEDYRHERNIQFEERDRIKRERDFAFRHPTTPAEVLIGLTRKEKDAEALEALKNQLYRICDRKQIFMHNYLPSCPSDKMGIALAFKDFKTALYSGMSLLGSREIGGEVRQVIHNDVLPNVGDEERKSFIQCLSGYEDITGAFNTARSYGLTKWLLEDLSGREHMIEKAGKCAEMMGMKGEAIALFRKCGEFRQAAKIAEGAEKAELSLLDVDSRYTRSSSSDIYYKERGEGNLEKELKLRERQYARLLLEAMPANPPVGSNVYADAVARLAKNFITGKNYALAALFMQGAGFPQGISGTLPQNVLEDAERQGDFVACYHLVSMAGKRDEAAVYRTLVPGDRKLPEKLADLVEQDK